MVANVLKHLETSEASNDMPGERIVTKTKAFTAKETGFQTAVLEYVEGFIENKSEEPDSRFERKVQSDTGSVGKIRLDGAADQALQGFSSEQGSGDEGSSYYRALVAVVGTGKIVAETVSWLGAIARRYGLEGTARKAGRTASRRGRQFAPNPDEYSQ